MDISQCIAYLELGKNQYELTQSIPPHAITSWEGEDKQPTQKELEAAWSEIQKEQVATEYKRKRLKEYPPIQDQLDMIYHMGVAGWKAEIKKTKDKYPKPQKG